VLYKRLRDDLIRVFQSVRRGEQDRSAGETNS
jgi:hypothetical protein